MQVNPVNERRYRFKEQLETLRSQMLMGAIGSVCLGIYGVHLFWHEQYRAQMLVWLAILIVSCLTNYLYAVSTKECPDKKALFALNMFTFLGFIAGIIWSVPALWLASGAPEIIAPGYGSFFIIIAIMGMATSAMGSTSAYLPMYYISVTPFTVALIFACFVSDIPGLALFEIGMTLLLFVLAIFGFTYNINLSLIKEIDLRHQNLLLAKSYLKEKENAEEANRQKSQFLAAASHDLRQPLQSLCLYSSILENDLKENSCSPLLDKMNTSIEALNSLFTALLDVSRLDAGDVQTKICSVELYSMLARGIEGFKEQARLKGVNISLLKSSLYVETDEVLLQRCISNLLSNALNHANSTKILVAAKRRGTEVEVFIVDNGCGIPHSEHTNIFREFYQLNNPERNRQKGLGLGLSIVKRTLNLLEHNIEIKSTTGKGSCFSITLRRVLPPTQVAEADKNKPWNLNKITVLVIDDEQDVRIGLSLLLQRWNARVISASGIEELDMLMDSGERPDMIISDYRLPKQLTGSDLIQRIREQLNKNIPALLLTGDTAPERINQARSSGVLLLHKPVPAAKLRMALNKLLSERKYIKS